MVIVRPNETHVSDVCVLRHGTEPSRLHELCSRVVHVQSRSRAIGSRAPSMGSRAQNNDRSLLLWAQSIRFGQINQRKPENTQSLSVFTISCKLCSLNLQQHGLIPTKPRKKNDVSVTRDSNSTFFPLKCK